MTTDTSFDEFESSYLTGTRRLSDSNQSGSLREILGESLLSQYDRPDSVASKDSLCLSDAENEADEFMRQQANQKRLDDQSHENITADNTIQNKSGNRYSSMVDHQDNSSNLDLNDNEIPHNESLSNIEQRLSIESLTRSNDPNDIDLITQRIINTKLCQINENEAQINSHDDAKLQYEGIDVMSAKREITKQLSNKAGENLTSDYERNHLNRLQQQYSKAIEDFKILRYNLSENMERNLNRTEQLGLKHNKTGEQYRSYDNILRNNYDLGARTQSDVNFRNNKHLQRYSSQEVLYKRHSGMNYDLTQDDYTQNSPRTIQKMFTNNNYDHHHVRHSMTSRNPNDFPISNELQREHLSNLRDQAAKSNFERYLRGSTSSAVPSNTMEGLPSYNNNNNSHFDDPDVGYGGSGSTSPRDIEGMMLPSDRLSSRSGSVNSRHSSKSSALASIDSGVRMSMSFVGQHNSLVVVAIDFGTTFSGYAFSFTRDSTSIHMMRRWEGGDPGVTNQKTPTTLLLKPDGSFHSFGFGARDFYHDLDASEAKKWLYFDKFKMTLHSSENLHAGIEIKAANGKLYPALKVFSHALRFFKQHVLAELSDQSTAKLGEEDITWVLTVPAIWRQPAKQFMRTAAYEAGIASIEHPSRLLIALEPEAASIFCRKLRIRDCVIEDDLKAKAGDDSLISEEFAGITQYIVVDCGGGTVDLTVHELDVTEGTLKELHKGTGGPSGATGVDREFEKLLKRIFDADFIEKFKIKRPAAWIDLMISFEAKKRTARPDNQSPLNLSLPFSFIEYHKKHRKISVETAIKKFKNPDIKWSSQGMLRFSANVMQTLFEPVVNDIIGHIQNLLTKASLKHVEHLFLVGGFAESPLLQYNIREALEGRLRVIIPNDVGLAILKGAVLFGLDPTVVRVRRSAYTYGVGVLNKFDSEKHEQTKRVVKDGIVWCKDIFDRFVRVDESVGLGDRVTRSYAPARSKQKSTVINIYCTEKLDVLYTTDKGVTRCGKLRIEMPDVNLEDIPIEKRGKPRELQASMIFGDTEIKVSAVDVLSGRAARANIDFLNY